VYVSAARAARPPRPAGPARISAPSRAWRILGIDPGTLRMGYGVVECRGTASVSYVECGVLSASPRSPRLERLCEIGRGLRELLAELRPDAVAMEEAFFGKSVQATLALGEARGVALFIAGESGLSVTGYPPATVKQSVVGHGRATKEQIGYLVRALLSMRRPPAADAADALAIAICHARSGARPAEGAAARVLASGPGAAR
jgi:crossover junction endodeoxyribonuclease RuvC